MIVWSVRNHQRGEGLAALQRAPNCLLTKQGRSCGGRGSCSSGNSLGHRDLLHGDGVDGGLLCHGRGLVVGLG